ncbi:cyclin-dependent kinase inhibitor 1C-like [Catharus ustulatus]|uniref:cyclin-dependent kinase inhibitor 1C-like n=1 Tax=Catharus ustulatus TaxID=91951 RepID=UPI00140E908F|nr:cyclin-dependent kinase inhibitor 1C-like [Catharus ustulatus]
MPPLPRGSRSRSDAGPNPAPILIPLPLPLPIAIAIPIPVPVPLPIPQPGQRPLAAHEPRAHSRATPPSAPPPLRGLVGAAEEHGEAPPRPAAPPAGPAAPAQRRRPLLWRGRSRWRPGRGRLRQQRRGQRDRDGARERSGGARHPRAPDSLLLVRAALGRGSSAAVAHGAQPGAGPGGGRQLGHPVPEREEAARLPRQRLRPERHHASRAPHTGYREALPSGTLSMGEPAKKHCEVDPVGQGFLPC